MAQEYNTSGNVRVSQAAEHKGSGFAVPRAKAQTSPLAGFEGSFYRKGSATYMVIMVKFELL